MAAAFVLISLVYLVTGWFETASSALPSPFAECRNYTTLNTLDRSQGVSREFSYKCDQTEIRTKGWYRFSGAAGSAMPTSCVPKYHCGTAAPGWMQGLHPTVAQGAVSRKVCFHWVSNCCNWNKTIRVRNCGGFYVYELDRTPGCYLRYCGNAGAECVSYKTLNTLDRSQEVPRGNLLKCDQNEIRTKGWYRFSGAAGSAMPTSCVPKYRCGTNSPGWMQGSHPTVAQGAVSRKVCFHWVSNCCNWNKTIRVRNCGGFYVYELDRTPVCYLRYCGNAGAECRSYKTLNTLDRSQGVSRGFAFKCDQNEIKIKGWYRFSGAAGSAMPTSCVPTYRCGTAAPGWMQGLHPTVAQGAVSRKVCFHWGSNCCNWNKMIRVRNCGGFYVYELNRTPVCNLRYCGNAGAPVVRPLPSIAPQSPGAKKLKIQFEFDSPLYPTVYHVIEGALYGILGTFPSQGRGTTASLRKDDMFTVILNVANPIHSSRYGWYEIPAIFCFGDSTAGCLSSAKRGSRTFSEPYLMKPSSVEKPVPFMVPFVSFTYVKLPNGNRVPSEGIVHPEFSQNFTFNGARYDPTTGVLASFSTPSSVQAGKLANIKFARKRNYLSPQPLTECYFVEWAPDGCLPGLNVLMKAWNMRNLKITSSSWLKFGKFPSKRNQDYVANVHIFGYGSKSYVVPKGVVVNSVAIGSVPFSRVFSSVEETVKTELQSYGIKYKEKSAGIFQGSASYKKYSKLYSKRSYSSATAGVEYKLFSVRFTNSFNFKDSNNWDDDFRAEWRDLLNNKNQAKAMKFFQEYGTHYIREAEMGGRKESLFSVDYCKIVKEAKGKAGFEADILLPYKGRHRISPSTYYQKSMSQSRRKMIVSGPITTCRGGNSLNRRVCLDDSQWYPTVLQKPYPVTMVVEPFYTLPSSYNGRSWLKEKYKEYLVANLDAVEIRKDLDMKVECSAVVSEVEIYLMTLVISSHVLM